MADNPRRPLLNPVLRFTKDPKPEGVTGGGKSARGIKVDRLAGQRRTLAAQFSGLSERVSETPRFNGHAIIYAAMFDDSLAPTWTPSDLFQRERGARLVTPFREGYLIEVETDVLASYARLVRQTSAPKDEVDISRVESVRFFKNEDAVADRSLDEVWEAAPDTEDGRAFVIWLMPLKDGNAAEHLLKAFSGLRDGVIEAPPPLLESMRDALDASVPAVMRRSLRSVAAVGDRLNLAMREYRQNRRSRTTAIVPSRRALEQLVASGSIFRIEPVQPITSTSPGEGREPDRPLPRDMSGLPIVGVVDGGLTASSYKVAEAWKAHGSRERWCGR